uniref:Uncharacterized protein n=1 Tax=Rhizophora mucronata TaxID=61149 RepID=A0A2P2QKZ8_RHIMU
MGFGMGTQHPNSMGFRACSGMNPKLKVGVWVWDWHCPSPTHSAEMCTTQPMSELIATRLDDQSFNPCSYKNEAVSACACQSEGSIKLVLIIFLPLSASYN